VMAISVVIFRKQVSDLGLTEVGLNITALELGIALVLMALARGVGNAMLSRRTALLQLAGRCSYEIYLTHMFVVLGLMHPFRGLFGAERAATAAYLATYVIMLVLSVLLGYAVERRYSDPLNEALRGRYAARLARRWSQSGRFSTSGDGDAG
jgi:peptidoglycan/LPS O-acetylase OafA/YrhL